MHLSFDRKIDTPVSTKTLDGKTYREIEPELLKPLPAEWHEIKKLGWSKKVGCDFYYGFCPWWRLRQRLRDLVGSDGFKFEIVEIYPSMEGDPIYVGVLNILGVEHQGTGYGRSHSDYKGGREEIAYADAFKNAAEQHGLGAYLDDQKELVRYLLAAKHPEAKAIADQLKVQFIKTSALTQREIKEAISIRESTAQPAQPQSAPAQPAPAQPARLHLVQPQPAPAQPAQPQQEKQKGLQTGSSPSVVTGLDKATKPYLYPQHNSQIKALRNRLGVDGAHILELTNGVHPGHLSLEDFDDLVTRLVLDWVQKKGFYRSDRDAKDGFDYSYRLFCQEQQKDLSLLDAVYLWVEQLQRVY